jgi:hypothetical protein
VVSDGRLILAGSEGRRSVADSLDLALRHRMRLGEASHFLASATPGRLWLAKMRYGRQPRLSSIREVTATGRPTFVSHRAPALYLAGALDDGLLFEQRSQLIIWSPRSGRIVRRMRGPHALAVTGSRVARCAGRCSRVHVTGPDGDRVLSLPAPAVTAAFSPDGALLAVTMAGGRIAVVDVGSAAVRELPGRRDADAGVLAWGPDGDWLFFARGRGRLVAYEPASGRLEGLPGRLPGRPLEVAAG